MITYILAIPILDHIAHSLISDMRFMVNLSPDFCDAIEYWLNYYNPQSYILILDFRDTFFQASPFSVFGSYESRIPKYDLHVFAENHDVCIANNIIDFLGQNYRRLCV